MEKCDCPKPASAEPVAWVDVKDSYAGPYEFHGLLSLPAGKHYLFASPQPDALAAAHWEFLAKDYHEKLAAAQREIERLAELAKFRMELAEERYKQISALESELAAANERINELEETVAASIDDGIDKIMSMSDEQISALTRLEGSDPDDVARIGKLTCKLAISNAKLAAAEKLIDECEEALKALREDSAQMLSDVAGMNCEENFSRCFVEIVRVVDPARASIAAWREGRKE